jgi:hypothetical protein
MVLNIFSLRRFLRYIWFFVGQSFNFFKWPYFWLIVI